MSSVHDGDGLKCSFCGKGPDEVLRIIEGPGAHICDECVDDCIAKLVEDGLVPDLTPLEEGEFIFKPRYLTENDVRGEMSLLEFKSLPDEAAREALIDQITLALRNDELTKLMMESVSYRMLELFWKVLEKSGFSEEARFTDEAMRAIGGSGTVAATPDPRFVRIEEVGGRHVARFYTRFFVGPDMSNEFVLGRESLVNHIRNTKKGGGAADEYRRALRALDAAASEGQ